MRPQKLLPNYLKQPWTKLS